VLDENVHLSAAFFKVPKSRDELDSHSFTNIFDLPIHTYTHIHIIERSSAFQVQTKHFIKALKIGFISFDLSCLEKGCWGFSRKKEM